MLGRREGGGEGERQRETDRQTDGEREREGGGGEGAGFTEKYYNVVSLQDEVSGSKLPTAPIEPDIFSSGDPQGCSSYTFLFFFF